MDYSPIPTPPSQKFRHFRLRFLPPLVFACNLAAILALWRDFIIPSPVAATPHSVQPAGMARIDRATTNLQIHGFQVLKAEVETHAYTRLSLRDIKQSATGPQHRVEPK